jgi:ribonuclease P protein component
VSVATWHPAEVMAKATAGSRSRLVTLKTRAEFLRIRKGARWATPAFVLEAKERGTPAAEKVKSEPRFGFTVTRQVGKAVERNRIRRRLKAAVLSVQANHTRADYDYVLIARRTALESAFGVLVADLATALDRVNSGAKRDRRGGASRSRQDRAT